MSEVYYITEETLSNVIINASLVGFIFGLGVMLLLLYFMREMYFKNFKMYFLDLSKDEQELIKGHLDDLGESLNFLSGTNTKLFKMKYNAHLKLEAYLKKKWGQN